MLENLGVTQSELARHIGVHAPIINVICRGKRGITAQMALRLGAALGTGPEMWLKLQIAWDLEHCARPKKTIRKMT